MHFMYRSLKFLSKCYSSNIKCTGSVRRQANFVTKLAATEQIETLKSALENNVDNWSILKSNVLSKQGTVNEKNVDAVILKTMVRSKKFELALSFVDYLMSCNSTFNVGVTNSILSVYKEVGKETELSEAQKQFILNSFDNLYKQYNVVDFITGDVLLHALCVIDELKKALKVFEDVQLSGTPSHSAYSTLIGAMFRNNKEKDALAMIQKSELDSRPLQFTAFKEWIAYFLRKYKTKATILKHLDKINEHISANCSIVSEETAKHIKNTYISLGYRAEFSKIIRNSGQCSSCQNNLNNLQLTNEEFELLQNDIKEKLIVGSDLFLKTSPKELNAFTYFLNRTAPYDVVLDALNIGYAMGKTSHYEKMLFLKSVVDQFSGRNKRILLLGRKHMFNWHQPTMKNLMARTYSFFTDNISQDDPYFITAAIVSGPNTDIVSKDLFRAHRFVLKDQNLKKIFQRWQWQHQWMVFRKGKRAAFDPPLQFTPCAQKNSVGWHIPYQKDDVTEEEKAFEHDGIPDYNSWLCIRAKDVDSTPKK